ncbi:MAG TPA: MFS transporter [Thermoplasmata archaeon]|nr:MFS transporter [Thermoplasmata archaeon]
MDTTAPTPAASRPLVQPGGLGHSLRFPGFRNLFSSSAASTFGAAVSIVAVSWIVYHYTGSALDVAYLGLVEIGPGIVLGLVAGVVADRYNRRSLMVTADLTRMVGMAILAVGLYFLGFSLLLVFAIMVVVESFSALFTPASQAILPRLVEKGSLEDANGLLFSSSGVARSVGSATGGVVVAVLGAVWGLGINAVTYALSAIFILQIASQLGRISVKPSGERRSFSADFSEGIRYVLGNRTLSEVSFGYLPSNFLSSFVSPFFVVYATIRFGGSAVAFGYLAAALAFGTAAGGLIVGRLSTRRRAGWWLGSTVLLEAAMYGVLAASFNLGISVLAAFGAGIQIGFGNTVYYSVMQASVPSRVLGRVLSIVDFGSFVAIPVGLVVGGLLIARYGIGTTITIAAIGIFATGVALLSLRDFRAFGERTIPPDLSS